jgi:flagellar hook-associated protein 2
MSTAPTNFNGTSTFSTDLQAVLSRAVAIRSLGINSLNTAKAQIGGQSTAVGALDTVFTNLQNAVTAINTSTGVSSLSSAVSTTGVVQPTLSTGALPGVYNIEVTALGSATSTLSKDGLIAVSDPPSQDISAGTNFTLTINGVDTPITSAATNLNSLVAAINAQSSLNVQASIVNVGSSGTPDYRLAVQSTKLGPNTIQLKNGPTLLLDTLSTGGLANYKVNGRATVLTSDSSTVTLAPGLSVKLLAQSPVGQPTTITVSQSTASISNAFSAFASAYNAAVAEINKSHGTTAGSLAGDSLLSTLSQSLHDISFYDSGAASLSNLTSLGFSFDKNGVLSFDSTAFSNATAGNTGALNIFLGDTTTGFLKAANDTLAGLEDPTNGIIKTTLASLAAQSANEDALIAAEQARIDQFSKDETARISAADALLASMQQKANFVSGLFAAETAATTAMK